MRREHASFSAFVDTASDENIPRGLNDSRHSPNGAAWTGSNSFETTLRFAREGWQEGREEIEKHRANFAALVGSKVRRAVLSHDMAGFAPDVGAFLQGEPECMFSREMVEADAPGKILRVVINGSCHCGVRPGEIIRRGALICALIDVLEAAGHACEVTVCFGGSCGSIKTFDFIPLKQAGEALELDRAAFALAHPSMFRRLIFSAWEQDLPYIQRAGSGFGMPLDAPQADRGDLYFGAVDAAEVPDNQVIPWFKAQLAPLGITFDE